MSSATSVAVIRPLIQRAIDRRRAAPLRGSVLNIAHRGAAGEAPENTLAAFELAFRQGADAIECDVHLSADGVPVVIHDAWLDRTTSGSGWVGQHSVAALKRLNAGAWFNLWHPTRARPRYSGLRIPLLAEALEWVRAHNCPVLVEIKQGGPTYAQIEESVLAGVYRAGAGSLATLISFDLTTLRRLRELDSQISLGASFRRPLLVRRRAKLLAASSLVPHWAIASRRFIRRAHEAGLQVFVWTVNQPRRMRRQIRDGVDGIITDYPARLAAVRAQLESRKSIAVQMAQVSGNVSERSTD